MKYEASNDVATLTRRPTAIEHTHRSHFNTAHSTETKSNWEPVPWASWHCHTLGWPCMRDWVYNTILLRRNPVSTCVRERMSE